MSELSPALLHTKTERARTRLPIDPATREGAWREDRAPETCHPRFADYQCITTEFNSLRGGIALGDEVRQLLQLVLFFLCIQFERHSHAVARVRSQHRSSQAQFHFVSPHHNVEQRSRRKWQRNFQVASPRTQVGQAATVRNGNSPLINFRTQAASISRLPPPIVEFETAGLNIRLNITLEITLSSVSTTRLSTLGRKLFPCHFSYLLERVPAPMG